MYNASSTEKKNCDWCPQMWPKLPFLSLHQPRSFLPHSTHGYSLSCRLPSRVPFLPPQSEVSRPRRSRSIVGVSVFQNLACQRHAMPCSHNIRIGTVLSFHSRLISPPTLCLLPEHYSPVVVTFLFLLIPIAVVASFVVGG